VGEVADAQVRVRAALELLAVAVRGDVLDHPVVLGDVRRIDSGGSPAAQRVFVRVTERPRGDLPSRSGDERLRRELLLRAHTPAPVAGPSCADSSASIASSRAARPAWAPPISVP